MNLQAKVKSCSVFLKYLSHNDSTLEQFYKEGCVERIEKEIKAAYNLGKEETIKNIRRTIKEQYIIE